MTSCLRPRVLLEGFTLPPTITFLWVSCRRRFAVSMTRCKVLRMQLPQRLKPCRCGTQIVLWLALQRGTLSLLECMGMRPLCTPSRKLPKWTRSSCLLALEQLCLMVSLLPRNIVLQALPLMQGSAARLTPKSAWTLSPRTFPHRPRILLLSPRQVLWSTTLLGPPWRMHPP